VADPARGSGLVEALTAGLAERAWAVLGEIDAQGGIGAAVESGWLAARVGAGAEARRAEIRRRKRVLIGANEYLPPPGQPVPPRAASAEAPPPPPGAPPAPLHAAFAVAPLDADWRALRGAVAGRPGRVPAVRVGPEKDTAARFTWTARLLSLAGLELGAAGTLAPGPAGWALDGTGGTAAPVVALIATDAVLAADGPALVAALRAAGAGSVLIAGPPGPHEAALRAAGAGFFVFLGADAVDALGALHAAVTVEAAR
jgi:methylmalonyl-CoA mutase